MGYEEENNEDITKIPQKDYRDGLHTAGKAVISAFPILGGSAVEIFNELITPPIENRRDLWVQRIAIKFLDLEERVKILEGRDLKFDDRVMTIILQASQSAIRNHQEEKLEALQNAILNSALNPSIDENIQLMFVNNIDSMTPWHILLLKYFEDPKEWLKRHNLSTNFSMGGIVSGINIAFPTLKNDENFVILILEDLMSKGFLKKFGIGGTMTVNGVFASRTSDMGDKFIEFISTPKIMQEQIP